MKIVSQKFFTELCHHLDIRSEASWEKYFQKVVLEHGLPYPCSPFHEYPNFTWEYMPRPFALGEYIKYEHASFLAQQFGILNLKQWVSFIKTTGAIIDVPIPLNPPEHYGSLNSWQGWPSFLNTNISVAKPLENGFLIYEQARMLMKTLCIQSPSDYEELIESGIAGPSLPSNPAIIYKEWVSWSKFLAPSDT